MYILEYSLHLKNSEALKIFLINIIKKLLGALKLMGFNKENFGATAKNKIILVT